MSDHLHSIQSSDWDPTFTQASLQGSDTTAGPAIGPTAETVFQLDALITQVVDYRRCEYRYLRTMTSVLILPACDYIPDSSGFQHIVASGLTVGEQIKQLVATCLGSDILRRRIRDKCSPQDLCTVFRWLRPQMYRLQPQTYPTAPPPPPTTLTDEAAGADYVWYGAQTYVARTGKPLPYTPELSRLLGATTDPAYPPVDHEGSLPEGIQTPWTTQMKIDLDLPKLFGLFRGALQTISDPSDSVRRFLDADDPALRQVCRERFRCNERPCIWDGVTFDSRRHAWLENDLVAGLRDGRPDEVAYVPLLELEVQERETRQEGERTFV